MRAFGRRGVAKSGSREKTLFVKSSLDSAWKMITHTIKSFLIFTTFRRERQLSVRRVELRWCFLFASLEFRRDFVARLTSTRRSSRESNCVLLRSKKYWFAFFILFFYLAYSLLPSIHVTSVLDLVRIQPRESCIDSSRGYNHREIKIKLMFKHRNKNVRRIIHKYIIGFIFLWFWFWLINISWYKFFKFIITYWCLFS